MFVLFQEYLEKQQSEVDTEPDDSSESSKSFILLLKTTITDGCFQKNFLFFAKTTAHNTIEGKLNESVSQQ